VYASLVTFAVEHLLATHPSGSVPETDIQRVVRIARTLNPDLVNDHVEHALQRDVTRLLRTHGEALRNKRNRGRRDDIIRGALR